MATLVAIAYPDQGTAEQARGTVARLEADLIIQADQVASISRDPEGKYHVHTSHGGASTGAGAWWGGFWGLLFGMLFFIPVAGIAIGAGMGALFDHLGAKGIDKAFQQEVREYVQPGTSALFIVVEQVTPEKAIGRLAAIRRDCDQDLAVRRRHCPTSRGAAPAHGGFAGVLAHR